VTWSARGPADPHHRVIGPVGEGVCVCSVSPLGHHHVGNRPRCVIGWAASGPRMRPSFVVGVTAEVTQSSPAPAPRPDRTARLGRAGLHPPAGMAHRRAAHPGPAREVAGRRVGHGLRLPAAGARSRPHAGPRRLVRRAHRHRRERAAESHAARAAGGRRRRLRDHGHLARLAAARHRSSRSGDGAPAKPSRQPLTRGTNADARCCRSGEIEATKAVRVKRSATGVARSWANIFASAMVRSSVGSTSSPSRRTHARGRGCALSARRSRVMATSRSSRPGSGVQPSSTGRRRSSACRARHERVLER
jgi:hypothetical protein